MFSFLTSRRIVSILLGAFIVLLVLGALIPQENSSPLFEVNVWQNNHPLLAKVTQVVGGTKLYTSYPFLVVSGLLLLSTAMCTVQRIGLLRKEELPSIDTDFSVELSPQALEEGYAEVVTYVRHCLRKHGCFAKTESFPVEAIVVVRKGGLGRWGSVLFHFSFLILLIGALASVWTRSEGSFILTEGQSFRGTPAEFVSRQPAALPWYGVGDFEIVLQQFVPQEGQPPTYASKLIFSQEGKEAERLDVRTFQAGSYAGRTFYQKEHGFSPRFLVKTAAGQDLFDGFVALASSFSDDEVRYENVFSIVEGSLKIEGQLFPDAVQKAGQWRSLSPKPNRPVFLARIEQRGVPVFEGPIPLGEALELEGLQISFTELRYWSGLQMVTDLGVPILYAGFFLGCLGLVLRTLISSETFWLKAVPSAETTSLVLYGAAERDQALFAEKFQVLVDELRAGLREMKGDTIRE